MCQCKAPAVRISEQTGRVFCATCREYLDVRSQSAPDALRARQGRETSIAPSDDSGPLSTDSTSPVDNTPRDVR